MSRIIGTFILVLSLITEGSLSAQTSGSSGDLATGIRQVEDGDLDAAVITLDSVVRQLTMAKSKERELAMAHLYLGMAHLGLSQWERAKSEMREAWRSNQQMKLDPKKFPPRVMQLYEEAKAEAEKAGPSPKPETKTAKATPNPAPIPSAALAGKKSGSKTAIYVLGGLAVAGGVGVAAAGGGELSTPTAAPVQVFVSANQGPNGVDSGVDVGAGRRLTMTASGRGAGTAFRALPTHAWAHPRLILTDSDTLAERCVGHRRPGRTLLLFPYESPLGAVGDHHRVQWGRDGATLYYYQTANLWKRPVAGGPAVQVTRFDDRFGDFEWSLDGKLLACSRWSSVSDAVLITNFR